MMVKSLTEVIGIVQNMNLKPWLAATLSLTLYACANPPQPPVNYLSKSESSLAEASYSVSRSIVDLAETEQAARPFACIDPPPNPASYGMAGLTTIDWSGPIEPLLKQIAMASNYRLRVLGNQPAIPVLVTINAKNTMLGDILRDAGYQASKRANVVVFPSSRTIELRYAKN